LIVESLKIPKTSVVEYYNFSNDIVVGNEVHKIKYARKIGQTSIDG
jgi:hypothetical protein